MKESNLTFLYIEDDPASIKIMKMIMEKIIKPKGFVALLGSQDFMRHINALDSIPDIFFLDIHMSPYDGFGILKTLKSDRRFINSKIIAVTASVMGEEIDRLKSSGFDGAISKPLSISQFPALLQSILRGEQIWFIS